MVGNLKIIFGSLLCNVLLKPVSALPRLESHRVPVPAVNKNSFAGAPLSSILHDPALNEKFPPFSLLERGLK